MIILGLGSNIGDRLHHLRSALRLLKQHPQLHILTVSPVYISEALLPDNAPHDWNAPYFNLALGCQTTLSPHELLIALKNIEQQVGRTPDKAWGPRIIDIDLLAWDDLIHYDAKLHVPHEQLHQRPFALWPLADIEPYWVHPILKKTAAELIAPWGSRFSGAAPLSTRQLPHRIDTPELVGILNITPDSFSDGGQFLTIDHALTQAEHILNSGAEIIDIGAESTRPNAIELSSAIEWQRLEPVIKAINANKSRYVIAPKISVDTRHASVAEKALNLGVDWINDVSGFADPLMQPILAESHCDIVFMHHLGIPVKKNRVLSYDIDLFQTLYRFAEEKIAALSIDSKRMIFDVGIGYGKTAEQSAELLKNIVLFKQLNLRLLVGHSRKSFLTQFTEKPASDRDLETSIISIALAKQQVDYLRVHNIALHAATYKMAASFGLTAQLATV